MGIDVVLCSSDSKKKGACDGLFVIGWVVGCLVGLVLAICLKQMRLSVYNVNAKCYS